MLNLLKRVYGEPMTFQPTSIGVSAIHLTRDFSVHMAFTLSLIHYLIIAQVHDYLIM
jgi:hypothetical protein